MSKPECCLILIGFMGSGKSTVARELSRLNGWPIIDLDAQIVADASCSIDEIFRRDGEERFRQLETAALTKLGDLRRSIVATGGGIIGRAENWPLLRRLGVIIYLKADWTTLRQRLSGSTGRPLAAPERGWDEVEKLLRLRQPLYEQADLVIETDQLDAATVAREILARTGQGEALWTR